MKHKSLLLNFDGKAWAGIAFREMFYIVKIVKTDITLDTFINDAYFDFFHKIQRQKSVCFTKCSLKTIIVFSVSYYYFNVSGV